MFNKFSRWLWYMLMFEKLCLFHFPSMGEGLWISSLSGIITPAPFLDYSSLKQKPSAGPDGSWDSQNIRFSEPLSCCSILTECVHKCYPSLCSVVGFKTNILKAPKQELQITGPNGKNKTKQTNRKTVPAGKEKDFFLILSLPQTFEN